MTTATTTNPPSHVGLPKALSFLHSWESGSRTIKQEQCKGWGGIADLISAVLLGDRNSGWGVTGGGVGLCRHSGGASEAQDGSEVGIVARGKKMVFSFVNRSRVLQIWTLFRFGIRLVMGNLHYLLCDLCSE